jgi:3-hydroxyacyl-[acyl-carrier-protein] dehydratase
MWYSIKNNRCSPSGEIFADIEMEAESPWFSGHFPGEPILPGIAQLAMIIEAARVFSGHIKVAGFKRVRFKQIVRPESQLQIFIRPDKGKSGSFYAFQIKSGDDIVCSGIMVAEKE